MIVKEKHEKYVLETMETRDILYYLTDPLRIATAYWTSNSLRMLGSPHFEANRAKILTFVKSCFNEDGGFGGTKGYPSTILCTFHALQILFLYNTPFYSAKTINYIIGHQKEGAFCNDGYGEKDTRFDCCAILSLHLLCKMREHVLAQDLHEATRVCKGVENKIKLDKRWVEDPEAGFFFEDSCPLDRKLLAERIPTAFLEEIRFDTDGFLLHLHRCYNPDGGFGQEAGSESHAAQIFCVLSALRVIGLLASVDRDKIEEFLVFRQNNTGGLCGRTNKKEDVCYSFWALSSLKMLNSELIDTDALQSYIFRCEGPNGGFSDRPGNECDAYHQMFSLASLSLMGYDELGEVDPGFAL